MGCGASRSTTTGDDSDPEQNKSSGKAVCQHGIVMNGTDDNIDNKDRQPSKESDNHTEAETQTKESSPETSTSAPPQTGPAQKPVKDDDQRAALKKLMEDANKLQEKIDKFKEKKGQHGSLLDKGDSDEARKAQSTVKRLMKGDLSVQYPSTQKTVRIFVSSTFTDTLHERNWLMEKVYPNLKEFCQSRGYDFQVVDMRWGIRDVAQDDHKTTEICLQEVELCKTQSTGPCFLSLVSHKYGYRDFPRKIPETDFDKMIGHVDDDAKSEIVRWFKKDENDVPAMYILQPISAIIPDSKSEVSEIQKDAMAKWYAARSKMHNALATSAAKVLSEKSAEIYKRSVTEAETMHCLSDAQKENVLWYHRIIQDINEVDAKAEQKILRRYKDISEDPEKDKESQQLLQQLRDEKIKPHVDSSNIKEYTVQWHSGKGIDPSTNASHKQYLNQFCTDAESHMKGLLKKAFDNRDKIEEGNPVYQEVIQHTTFCQNKCSLFHGREDTLGYIENYIKDEAGNLPLVVHGPSGCGKTSLMAMAVKVAKRVLGEDAVVVYRFLGTTPDSTTLPGLLISLIGQLGIISDIRTRNLSNMKIEQLSTRFHQVANLVSLRWPLVIVLDSLDQLDPSHEAHAMNWLKMTLTRPKLKFILSTLPDDHYGILPALKDKLESLAPSNFLAVPSLSHTDITGIMEKWLTAGGRSLTKFQQDYIIDSFQNCPLPLYLKLSFDQACQWKSYMPQQMVALQSTVRGCINELFSKMEEFHGKVFVSRALGYLTASQTGLSEAELEDILSCDEEVLADVYRFWTPPLRRLPPLLLIRMKRDLGQYVVYRGADGKQVFYWYHRQFIEASYDRYCSDPSVLKELHKGLADYFAGQWAEGRCKPYIDKDKTEQMADRCVAPQPLSFGTELNERKLNRQVYHRTLAGQLQALKSECLINYKFVISKLNSSGLRLLLDDFILAKTTFPGDEEIEGISEALQLSQHALSLDIKTFPSQMLGRITNSKVQNLPLMSQFLANCREASHTFLQPDKAILTPAGGQLIHAIAEQSESINCLVVNDAGTVAVTVADDGSLKTFDVQHGKLLKAVKAVAQSVDVLKLACDDSLIVVNGEKGLTAFDLETVSKKWTLMTEKNPQFTVGGKNRDTIVYFNNRTYGFYKAESGKLIDQTRVLPQNVPMRIKFSVVGPAVAHEKWAVTVDSDQTVAFLFDIETQSLVKFDRLMKIYRDKNNEKVEPTVDGLQISLDGETLYVANYMDNNLRFFHTKTLEEYKMYTGCKHDFTDKFHLSLDGKYIYFPNNSFVRVWDLSTGKKATLFNRLDNKGIEDVFTADMETFVTSGSDRNIQIWNLSRGDEPGLKFEDLDEEHRVTMNKASVHLFEPTDDPELYVVIWTEENGDKKQQVLSFYDVTTSSFLKRYCHNIDEDGNNKMTSIEYWKGWIVKFESDQRVKFIDLTTMKVKTTLQGTLPTYSSNCVPLSNGEEIGCLSIDRHNFKIMNSATGKTNSIIKTGLTKKIDNFVTNKCGSVVVADCEGPFQVFNIAKRTLDFTIQQKDTQCTDEELYLSDAFITSDGVYLVFQGDYKMSVKDFLTSLHVFNLQTREQEHVLVDKAMYAMYKAAGQKEREVYFDSFKNLDDTRLISGHDDYIVRVFNFRTGQLLQRLEGHISYQEISIPKQLGGQVFLTNGVWSEEYCIRLWDSTSYNCLAVYSYDYDMADFAILGSDPLRIIARLKSEVQPVVFSLDGLGAGAMTVSSSADTVQIQRPKFDTSKDSDVLDLSDPIDLNVLDEDNPDSGEEEKDDDDDEDDEDDDIIDESEDDDDWLNN